MRCNNSKILRWMPFSCCSLIIFTLIATVNSGPTVNRISRMIRETYSNEESSLNNSTSNEDTCLMNGTSVQKSNIICAKKAGCRAIQQTGQCCPEYQCECTKDGKTYGNGEKLLEPLRPCRVCYCQGGEILCNPVRCYIRNDCEPKYINGRCCPEYVDCPTLEQVLAASKLSTTLSPLNNSDENSKNNSNETSNNNNDNPLGIKIKEITKVEEIRITNEKPKTTLPKISLTTQSLISSSTELVTETSSPMSKELADTSNVDSTQVDTITVSPSINPTAEKDSVTSTTSIESTTDSNQLPPSILHIGDRVIVVGHNSHPSPITVVEVEGLQRGDETIDEDLDFSKNVSSKIITDHQDHDNSNNSIIYENNEINENLTQINNENFDELFNSFNESINWDSELSVQNTTQSSYLNETHSLELEQENDTIDDHVASSSDNIQVLTTINDTVIEQNLPSSTTEITEKSSDSSSVINSSTTEKNDHNSDIDPNSHHNSQQKTYVEDDELPKHELINPGHASIPEDFSIFGRDQDLVSLDTIEPSYADKRLLSEATLVANKLSKTSSSNNNSSGSSINRSSSTNEQTTKSKSITNGSEVQNNNNNENFVNDFGSGSGFEPLPTSTTKHVVGTSKLRFDAKGASEEELDGHDSLFDKSHHVNITPDDNDDNVSHYNEHHSQ